MRKTGQTHGERDEENKMVAVFRFKVGLVVAAMALLTACGGNGAGDAAQGQQLFTGAAPIAAGKLPACTTCHAIAPGGAAALGPNLSNIGNRAATTVADETAEQYLRTAIINPNAYLAQGYQEGIMNGEYAKGLTDQQISDLVAYMLTLKSGTN